MFQSYKIIKYYCPEYELTDSEFGTVLGVHESDVGYWGGICAAVIREYSKRNLNVAANLAIALVFQHKQDPYWSIQQMMDDNRRYNPLFPQYEEDIQKYLVLL
jgi:hypothetical protein